MSQQRHVDIVEDRRELRQLPAEPPITSRRDLGRSWSGFVLATLVLAGIGLRVGVYFQNRPLWNDECALAINLITRSVGGLLGPLGLGQAAPVGFLFAVRGTTLLLGTSELALRLVPLLAGCGVLALAAWVARRYLSAAHGIGFVAVLCLSPQLVYYSSELKQYETDALVATSMILATLVALRAKVRLWPWTATLAGLIWFSHPGVFVAAACCVAVLLRLRRRAMPQALLACVVVGGSFVVNYVLFCRSTQGSAYLHGFWRDYLGQEGSASAQFTWIGKVLCEAAVDGYSFSSWQLAAVLLLAGAIALVLTKRSTLLLVAGLPVLLALVAAYLKLYPFYGRFLLFALPGIALLVSGGLAYSGRLRWVVRLACAGALAWAVVPMTRPLSALDYPPIIPTQFREVAVYLEHKTDPGDRLYVMGPAYMLFDYYKTRLDFSGVDLRNVDLEPGKHPKAGHVLRMDGKEEFWVLTANFVPHEAKTADQFLRLIDSFADRAESFSAGDAQAIRYVRRVKATTAPAKAAPLRDASSRTSPPAQTRRPATRPGSPPATGLRPGV